VTNAVIRAATSADVAAIDALYRRVAAERGGLARSAEEITPEYVLGFVAKSLMNGIVLVAESGEAGTLVGEIHCYGSGLQVFAHVLGELTVAVDPLHQGTGIGRRLFEHLLEEVATHRPDILRVELIARESNTAALRLYAALGFVPEGRLERRIRSVDGGYEADIFMAWHRDRGGAHPSASGSPSPRPPS
jgi:ribosomal protein S18 acetylase RimI-like enzyme